MIDDYGGYDALLLVAFGGPESIDDVAPFLARVTAGRPIPPERLAQVADRYRSVGGRSPLNARLRTLQATVAEQLVDRGVNTPVFWGNRNADPLLVDTIAEMRNAGVRRAVAWVASPYASYSTCRQYTEDIERARTAVGAGAPVVDRIGGHHDHPGLIGPAADRLVEALDRLPADRRDRAHLLFSAHSIPSTMAANCDYVAQLHEVARLVAQRVDPAGRHNRELVWQSRSGPPQTSPWLEPDVGDRIDALAAAGVDAVVLSRPSGSQSRTSRSSGTSTPRPPAEPNGPAWPSQRAAAIDDDQRFVDMVVDLFLSDTDPQRRPGPAAADCCHLPLPHWTLLPGSPPGGDRRGDPRPALPERVFSEVMNHARIATEALRFRLGTFSARVDSPPGLNADETGAHARGTAATPGWTRPSGCSARPGVRPGW